MINNSKIYLKTGNKPLTVCFKDAEKINRLYNADHITGETKIVLGNESFIKADIRRISVIKDSADPADERAEDTKKFYADEALNRAEALKDGNRWKDINFFIFIATSVGITPNNEMLEQVRDLQKTFFTHHPRRILCSPPIFYHLFPQGFKKIGNSGPEDLKKTLKRSGIKLIELAISRDMNLSKDFSNQI